MKKTKTKTWPYTI